MNPETKLIIIVAVMGGIGLLSPWLAWVRLQALEKKHGRKLLVRGINGEQAAKIILLRGEIPQVDVDETSLIFSNHYSAHEPAIKLSSEVYHGKRLFDVARAARLAGHALQHRDHKLSGIGSWDAFIVLWGNAWPLLLSLTFISGGRWAFSLLAFSITALVITIGHFTRHQVVRDAARRGQIALSEARLLDGHPNDEVEAAFLASRLDHLALPFTRTWWKLLLFKSR